MRGRKCLFKPAPALPSNADGMTIDTGRTEESIGAENDELRMKRVGCGERVFFAASERC
jgi:hypothetical protein